MRVKQGFVVRDVGGKKYAVPTGVVARSFKGMLSLNNMGAVIFEFLQTHTTKEEIVSKILAEYDAPQSVVDADVTNFITQLKRIDVIED